MNSSEINKGIADAIQDKMFRASLWGVLDISMMERRYEIIDIVKVLILNESFKKDGFRLRLIDHNNFIQKVPYFYGNNEFIDKYDLYFNDKPHYQSYLLHMKDNIKKD